MFSLLKRQSNTLAFLESLLLLAIVGWLDFVTGYEVSLVLFYSIPIAFAGWLCQRYTPFAVAALACVVWCSADLASGHQYFAESVHAWEIFVRSAFFFAVAVATVSLKDRHMSTEARVALLQHAQKLEHQVTEITEYEQQRVGRELHDGLSQYLAAVSCAMTSLKLDTEKFGSTALTAKASEIEKLLAESVNQARDLARNLAPVRHNGPGLAAALEELAAATTRRMGIECSFETSGEEAIKSDATATYLYRIAQEALDSAVKQGKANSVSLRLSANVSAINLTISDDGIGFSRREKNLNGVGIGVMEYRARAIAGDLQIEEGVSGGTVVSCTISGGDQS